MLGIQLIPASVPVQGFDRVAVGVECDEGESDAIAKVRGQGLLNPFHVVDQQGTSGLAIGKEHYHDLVTSLEGGKFEASPFIGCPHRINLVDGMIGHRSGNGWMLGGRRAARRTSSCRPVARTSAQHREGGSGEECKS